MCNPGEPERREDAAAERLDAFTAHRPLLFSIAYRMLGSVMDAEDMIQEAFLRWLRAPAGEVASPKAYLTTIITRLCIDHLRSARVRREQYVGPWLPEPLLTASYPDIAETAAQRESISLAFLVMLERLEPVERAVFLLREVFDYDYAEIAPIVDKTPTNCRQIVRRARERIADERRRVEVPPERQEALIDAFLGACANGDLPGLLTLLTDDITMWTDGGPHARAARRPIVGADRVARFSIGVTPRIPPGTTAHHVEINGQPGVVLYAGGEPHTAFVVDLVGDRIHRIWMVLNPDKLRHLPRGTALAS